MNAGSALGLLAGLGAINALRGGKDGKRFTSLIDMIDGGGAGQSGDKFEGGGLLSMLGNLFAKPYEAQDNVERIAKQAAVNKVAPPAMTVPKTVVQTAAMEDAYPQSDYGYDYPTYAPKLTTTAPTPASDPYAYLFQGQGKQPQAAPAPSGLLTPPTMTAPTSEVAPSGSMSIDPMIGGTRTPSASSPLPAMPEAQPAIDQSSGPMTFEQYAPYIIKKFQMEYGTNQTISPEKLQQAYALYRQSMGM